MIEFANPWLLLLLAGLPVAAWFHYANYRKRQASIHWSNLSNTLVPSWRERLAPFLPLVSLAALTFGVIALARPQTMRKDEQVKADVVDIMLAMDISSSMLAMDFKPDRLTSCKDVAAKFIDNRQYDRIGLTIFSGESFMQCPLTTDHDILKDFLAQIQPGILNDGTAIGMGLATAVNHLKDSDVKSKIVILLTDGVNNAGYVQPMNAAALAQTFGIKVYTIGVGTKGFAQQPIGRSDDGQFVYGMVPVEIDEDLLKEIAETTGGKYFRATNEETLSNVYAAIDKLEKTNVQVTVIRRYDEAFFPFLLIAASLFLLDLLNRWVFFRTV